MIAGILLAAGEGSRFGGNKLLEELGDGQCVGERSARALLPAVDQLIVVVRPGAEEFTRRMTAIGADVTVALNAALGIGTSIAHGVAQASSADAWLIALGDMPFVPTDDALRVAAALRGGAEIAVPVADGRRGHPVGFGRKFFAQLTALNGDTGARGILENYPNDVVEVAVKDAGAWLDIDTPADLRLATSLIERQDASRLKDNNEG